MTKKNDKRLCWNCDGSASLHLTQCPYCGVDLTHASDHQEFTSPFQNALPSEGSIPTPPYASSINQEFAVTEEEWTKALGEEVDAPKKEGEEASGGTKQEMFALILLLPGVVFFLFGLALLLFSSDGTLTLKWNQNFAYFYFLGAVPLLYLGWRTLR